MSNLKEIRTRIQSVAATRKITSAMKMVSAAKFHKAQETIFRYKPYANKAFEVLNQIMAEQTGHGLEQWYKSVAIPEKIALVVLTSNSSMCGGFNQNLIKKIMEDGPNLFPEVWGTCNIDFYCLGKKGNDFFSKKGFKIQLEKNEIVEKPNFNRTTALADLLIGCFLSGDYDAVYVAYNQFRNPAVQEPTIEMMLPLKVEKVKDSAAGSDIIFEPGKLPIANLLVPKTIKISLHRFVLESSAGEHGARMTAMHQATDNATEIINNLTLQYNKARQAAITKEILEIVSGAEAQKGK
jgi:F-type H+-transporting ATPase subunit gamma